MALVRRRPILSSSVLLIICAVAALGAARAVHVWPFAPAGLLAPIPLPYDPEEYEALDPVAATQIAELRIAAGLDDDALAACNLSDSELETVLAGVRTWFELNVSSWITNTSSVADKRALIRGCDSDIANGIDKSGVRAETIAQLDSAKTDRESLLTSLRSAVLNGFSEGVRGLIDLMRAQPDAPMPYRVLSLTSEQKDKIGQARSRYGQRCAATNDAGELAEIQTDFDTEIATILGQNNVTTLENMATYRGPASERVVAAVKKVLPVAE